MATQVQFRGGSSTEHNSFTGAAREVTVDTTKDTVIVHDGSTAGGHPLQKQYPALGTASAPTYTFTGDINTGIYSPGTDQVAISTNGTGRLFVNSSGRVGVGVTPSTTLFHVYTDAPGTTSAPTICLEGGANGYGAGVDFASRTSAGGTLVSMAKITADGEAPWITTASTQDAQLRFFTAADGSLSERLRITSAGKVGIGTSSPSSALDVAGAISLGAVALPSAGTARLFSRNTDSNLYIQTGGGNSLYILDGSQNTMAGFGSSSVFFNTGNTTRLTIDSSGNVGIGTTSPGSPLTIQSSAGNQVKITYPSIASYFLNATSGGDFAINKDGAERLRIDSSGRVGIGVTTMTGGNSSVTILRSNALRWADSDGTQRADIYGDTSSNLVFRNGTGSTERMRIDSSGNVGIGTTAPLRQLHISSTQAEIAFTSATNGIASLLFGDGLTGTDVYRGYLQYLHASDSMLFATSGTERLRIDSSGNVGIGTSSPSAKLDVNGSATFAGTVKQGTFNGGQTTTDGSVLLDNGGVYTQILPSSTSDLYRGYKGSSVVFKVEDDGSAEFAGTVSAQGSVLTSDQRFKENITDANAQLADVTALGNKLRNWDWTADAPVADKDTRFLGLVAQEAETVCPGIVTTIARTKDGAELTPEVVVPAVYETRTVPAVLDEEGEVVEAETTEQVLVTEEQVTPATYEQLDDSYKGIKNDILIMKLLGAVAELSAKVAALEGA